MSAIIRHPLAETVVKTDAAIFGIDGAISRLKRLVSILQIRECPVAREALQVHRLIAKECRNAYASLVSQLIQAVFPDAEPTLQGQLTKSVLYRRYRLIYRLSKSEKLQYAKRTGNANFGASRNQQQDMAGGTFSYPPPVPDQPEAAHGESEVKCPYCLDDIVIPQSETEQQKRARWV